MKMKKSLFATLLLILGLSIAGCAGGGSDVDGTSFPNETPLLETTPMLEETPMLEVTP